MSGLIPTYAGNTHSEIARIILDRAHPHVCGEHATVLPTIVGLVGSSPRMRGTPPVTACSSSPVGLIPTYAGNTPLRTVFEEGARAHPHVCGEHLWWPEIMRISPGSSPRMRGTRYF